MLRLEASDQLEEMPERRVGAGFAWHVSPQIYSTFEVLYGRYKTDYVEDEAENILNSLTQLAFQLTVAF